LPYIGSYPRRFKKLFYKSDISHLTENGTVYKSIKFCNLSLYKNFSRFYFTYKEILTSIEHNLDKHILVYAISTPFLKAALKAKKRYPNLKISLIIPDLPQFMSENNNLFYRFLKNINNKIAYNYLKKIDGFVLLSEHMRELLPINEKPYVVVEGIYNIEDENSNNTIKKDKDVKQIFYSGTLAKRYGIMNLVDAFTNLKNKNYRLVICGDGDSKNELIAKMKEDNRIQYLGNLSRNEVLKLQRNSDLLVNPRSSEGIFTKYSFPSKTMEYLASATPTLIYRLPGIPNDYYDYCFTIDNLGHNGLEEALIEVLTLSTEELEKVGVRAREFILKNKNPTVQCNKIISMLNAL
jgi:glycosyltransferase involved in cell wall biosynthesis